VGTPRRRRGRPRPWPTSCAGHPAATADPAEVALQATVVAVRTATAAELGPEPTATPVRDASRGDPVRGATLIAAVMTANATQTAVPAFRCDDEDLFRRLRYYRAAGAREDLQVTVWTRLERVGKPVSETGNWRIQERGRGCRLTLTVTHGNEPLTLTWDYDPTTGHLAAQDWQTKYYSGW
jgi:hypothetical protein